MKMDMEITIDKQNKHVINNNNNNNNNNALLPSLFGNHVVHKDGLMAINDSSLTQQIEFILQDATINENELEHIDTNPPNSTCASEQQQIEHDNNSNTVTTTVATTAIRKTNNTISAEEAQLLNERGIIIQSTRQHTQQLQQQQQQQQIVIEEDPELNDENLQDIEAETQESEAELQHNDEQYTTVSQIKLEQYETADLEQYTPTQLVLPNGTIVRTTSATNGLHTLSTLNRRPVYISEVPNVTSIENLPNSNTTTMISMPSNAVIRSVVNLAPTSIGTSVVVTSASHMLPPGVSIVPINSETLAAAPTETQHKKVVLKKSSKKSNSAQIKLTGNSAAANGDNSARSMGALLCGDCPERFESKELFDIHRSGHLNNMKCSICNMVLKSLKNYEKHCMRCKPYECQICGRIVRFRPNFIKHMRVHTACQAAERHKYKCEFCHKEFMSFEYFKVHKKIHNENVNLTCEICGKVFSALASLRGHSKLHSGHKLHKCDVCGKGFGQRYNLKIHARTHTGEFPFECSLCKKKLHTEKALETHLKIHQRADENGSTTRNRTIKKPKSLHNNNNNRTDGAASGHFEKPSTSGLQQLCAIASDNLKNFNATNMNETTDEAEPNCGSSNECDDDDDIIDNDNDDDDDDEHTSAHTIVINNVVQNKLINNTTSNVNSVPTSKTIAVITQSNQTQQKHLQVIQNNNNSNNNNNNNNDSVLKQQLMRQTPIIQTTSSTYIVQNKKTLSTPVSTPTIIMSRNGTLGTSTICTVGQPTQFTTTNQRHLHTHTQSPDRDISLDVDDEAHVMDAHDMVHETADENSCNSVLANDNATIMTMTHQVSTIHHARQRNGEHFDDDTNDDDKSSPSLATTAIIKQEPNFYSSGSADNSNDFIKEEVIFDDSQHPHSPRTHSSLSSKFCMSNFDTDHHGPMDLNHTLPPYGHLFESHSIPDSIPFARMDDDDFQLDHSSLGGLHNASNSTTDGEFLKKEWVYGTGNNFHMSGKFDEDTDPMCEPASFIYN